MIQSFFDGKIVHVRAVTQEILNWLDESDIKYITQPHLTRWKYSGPPMENPLMKGGMEKDSDFKRNGDDIIFDKEEDRMHFQLRWAEYIKSEDDPFEF